VAFTGDRETLAPLVSVMFPEIPRCRRCFERMTLARTESGKDGSEKRMFECPKCRFIETKMIADPLKSSDVIRLTEDLRPPT